MNPRSSTVRRRAPSRFTIPLFAFLASILGAGCGSDGSRVFQPDPYAGNTIGVLYAFAGPTSVLVHWSTRYDVPFDGVSRHEPSRFVPVKSRLLMSLTGPDAGFRIVAEHGGVGVDSLTANGLTNDRSYWFRSATYNTFGVEIARSNPIESQPGAPDVVIENFGSLPKEYDEPQPYFAWSPQGDAIVYVQSGDGDFAGNLFLHHFDGTADEPVTRFAPDGHVLLSVDWAPDSDRIAFVYSPGRTWEDSDYRIWATDASGAESTSLTSGEGVSDPAWGPAGALYFLRGVGGEPTVIQVEGTQYGDSTAHRTILSTTGYKHGMNVHPDGESIVYSAEDRGGLNRSLFVLDLSTLETRRLMPAEPWDDVSPCYARDGRSVVFCSRRSGTYQVWRYELASGRLRQLTRTRFAIPGPTTVRESPDGRRLAILQTDPYQNHSFVQILELN